MEQRERIDLQAFNELEKDAQIYELAVQKLREVTDAVYPHCIVDWAKPPHRTSNWRRFSLRLTFPSGFRVTIPYWWRGYWSR